MQPHGGDNGPRQIPSDSPSEILPGIVSDYVSLTQLKSKEMITQNPIVGRSKGRLAGVYGRTLYGKNIIQSCPPPTKGKQHPNQIKACTAFGYVSRLSNQISPSLLNNLYYLRPDGRSRRGQWCKDLATGMVKNGSDFDFDPSMIEILGGNPKVADSPLILTPTTTELEISLSDLSVVGNADTSQAPCIIMICQTAQICIDLLPFTRLNEQTLIISPLSTTVVGKQCWFFPLWLTNVGTQATPIMQYGRYDKNI